MDPKQTPHHSRALSRENFTLAASQIIPKKGDDSFGFDEDYKLLCKNLDQLENLRESFKEAVKKALEEEKKEKKESEKVILIPILINNPKMCADQREFLWDSVDSLKSRPYLILSIILSSKLYQKQKTTKLWKKDPNRKFRKKAKELCKKLKLSPEETFGPPWRMPYQLTSTEDSAV